MVACGFLISVLGCFARCAMRAEKVGHAIQKEVGHLLQEEIKDPRIGFATVVRVQVTADLRHAKVYVSILGDAPQKERALEGLASSVGFVRRRLGQTLRLRYTPAVTFCLDETAEHAIRIRRLLEEAAGSDLPSRTDDALDG
jgi:ribosome-binding factor A